MASDVQLAEGLSRELRRGLDLLQRLHVLAQTESLALDAKDLAELDSTVRAKEAVVAEIAETGRKVELSLARAGLSWRTLPPAILGVLDPLRKRSTALLDKIEAVDKRNRGRLEGLREEAARGARAVQLDRQLANAYGSTRPPSQGFSALAE